jgi:hypothetical protein
VAMFTLHQYWLYIKPSAKVRIWIEWGVISMNLNITSFWSCMQIVSWQPCANILLFALWTWIRQYRVEFWCFITHTSWKGDCFPR